MNDVPTKDKGCLDISVNGFTDIYIACGYTDLRCGMAYQRCLCYTFIHSMSLRFL
jgi:hypothetical protein